VRALPNWIDAFFEFTEFLPSPELFRKWSAIAAVAGALERKVWVHTQGSNLYPNLYTILVAPPGVGKSVLTSRVETLWHGLDDHFVASSNITKAALMDELNDANRTVVRPRETPPTVTFNSLKILSNELGVLLPQYESEFMSTLTDIYDGSRYSERRRSIKDKMDIERPQFNLLAATTPSHLKDFLPVGAFDQGFLSRSLLIYSGDMQIRPLFNTVQGNREAMRLIKQDMVRIGKLYGEMHFDESAADAITKWHMGGQLPRPEHPKLHNYCTRRTLHLLKLCMVSSASEGDTLTISLDQYRTALSWLIEAESYMPDIFKSMNSGGDSKVIEECWYFCYQLFSKKQQPVPESKVFNFLQQRIPAHSVERVADIMVRAGLLSKVDVNKIGVCYKPMEKHTHE
jgi:hypothetical protein